MLRAGSVGRYRQDFPGCWPARGVFEFRPPDGEPVRVKGTVPLHPDGADEPPQPVLYEPGNPKRAALLSEVASDLRVTESGGWEAADGSAALGRLALVVLLTAGPILAWFFLPPALP
jgi:hypothetical protein